MEKNSFDKVKNHSFNLGLYGRDIRLGEIASWAIWNSSDLDDTSIIEASVEKLKPNIVFVALNFGGEHLDIIDKPNWTDWKNFHSNSVMDKHLFKVLSGSKYEGAYLTDLFKCLPTNSAPDLSKKIRAKEIDIESQVHLFFDEISLLDSGDLEIYLMGGDTERFYNEYFKEYLSKHYQGKIVATRIYHPSPANPHRGKMREQLGLE